MAAVSLALDTPDLAELYERVSAERQFRSGQGLIEELNVTAGERVLDVGSGTGLLAEYVADLVGPNGSVIGIDPLPLRIALAQGKARSNLGFKVGNAFDLSEFPAESFDVVYLNAVFHWLPEKLEPLRQIHRVLKRGGRLGMSTGSKEHPQHLLALKEQVLSREPYRRYLKDSLEVSYRVSVDQLADLFGQTGFAVKKIDLRPFVRTDQTPTPRSRSRRQVRSAISWAIYLTICGRPRARRSSASLSSKVARKESFATALVSSPSPSGSEPEFYPS